MTATSSFRAPSGNAGQGFASVLRYIYNAACRFFLWLGTLFTFSSAAKQKQREQATTPAAPPLTQPEPSSISNQKTSAQDLTSFKEVPALSHDHLLHQPAVTEPRAEQLETNVNRRRAKSFDTMEPRHPFNNGIVPALPLINITNNASNGGPVQPHPASAPVTPAPQVTPGLMLAPNCPNGTTISSVGLDSISDRVRRIVLDDSKFGPRGPVSVPTGSEDDPEKETHQKYMNMALDMARLALRTNETPVGCVLVYKDEVIAKGMNATNVTRNGTKHAEYMALASLLSFRPADVDDDVNMHRTMGSSAILRNGGEMPPLDLDNMSAEERRACRSHLYPYGQKLCAEPRVPRSVVRECTLYVTVEPCVMCASLLRQLGIRRVFFGAVNDKFGGTGGVFSIHKNSEAKGDVPAAASAVVGNNDKEKEKEKKKPRPPVSIVPPLSESFHRLMSGGGASGGENNTTPINNNNNSHGARPGGFAVPRRGSASGKAGEADNDGGDGGNVEPGYEVEGGWGREEAVSLLRRFYVQENGRAPVPRKKEGRAARLAALMDGTAGNLLGGEPAEEEGQSAPSNGESAASNGESVVEEVNGADTA